MYDIAKYYQATDVGDAIAALVLDPDAVVICGGSDVLIKIREGKLAGCSLVGIRGIRALQGVRMEADGTVVIGPAATFSEITRHPLIAEHLPALGAAVDQAGGPQLRNIGTIGGNICNGMTSADSAPTLLTLNAELELTGPDGVRTVPQERFYDGPGRVRMAKDELLTAIRIRRRDYEGFGGHYIKYAMRNAMDIATLGCAVNLRLSADRTVIEDYRIAFGVAAPTPVRCRRTERAVMGRAITGALLRSIGPMALEEVAPRTSWRASKAFREQLIRENSYRATVCAITAAGGRVECE